MPRKTKEPTKKEENKLTKSKESKTSTTKTESKSKTPKKTTTKSAKVSKESTAKKETKKVATSAKAVKTTAKATKTTPLKQTKSATKSTKVASKSTAKKEVKKSTASTSKAKRATTTKKTTTKTTKKASTKKTVKKSMDFAPEYYDLPIKYNKTVVKILAQTPNNLFVYWEISDDDRENFKKQYGEYFFEITKPVLTVFNETLNYSFEIDIDDFANSWYLHVNDSNSEYKIELGRRPIPINYNYIPDYNIEKNGPIKPIEIPYIHISSSNELDTPNDRILFNNKRTVYFRNVKTNQVIKKQIKDLRFAYKDGKFINLYKLYKELYGNEIFDNSINLNNPSSGNPGSGSFLVKYR